MVHVTRRAQHDVLARDRRHAGKFTTNGANENACLWTIDRRLLYNVVMKTIADGKLKHRKPVAKRRRAGGTSAHLIGVLRGKIRVTGDIMSTGRKWHAQS